MMDIVVNRNYRKILSLQARREEVVRKFDSGIYNKKFSRWMLKIINQKIEKLYLEGSL
jgi:hypothetical protein